VAGLPDAADADAAISDYNALQARLGAISRPSALKTGGQMVWGMLVATKNGLVATAKFLWTFPARVQRWRATTPEEWARWRKELWQTTKHEAHHYWVGTKLLGYEMRIASRHAWKAARGKTLSRRERAQLTRTTADLARLVPMLIILGIPFLELLLPLLLKIFPNMLPSTFEDKLKKEEKLKQRLVIRLEMAKFLQDTVAEMAKDISQRKGSSAEADDLYQFVKKVRSGQEVENAEIVRFARLFNDELTLDNLQRVQLVGLCHFVGISPLGTDAFLRSRLRKHLSQIKKDDYEIEQEGLENMTEDELRMACRARGMRTPYGQGAVAFMERQLRDWLDLSLHRGLPSSLLLMSRAFTITAPSHTPSTPARAEPTDVAAKKDAAYGKLKEALGHVIPEEAVDSVAAEQGVVKAVDPTKALQQKLEFLKREEAAIRAELARSEEAEKAAAKSAAAKKIVRTAATAAIKEALKEEERAAQAAVASSMSHPSTGSDLDPASVSPEEAAEEEAQAREKRLRDITNALLDLATGSGVAKERKVFMDLMRNEIDRVNTVLSKSGQGSSARAMLFDTMGLRVSGGEADDKKHHETDPDVIASGRGGKQVAAAGLSDRVTRMLASIEKELDAVESKIGTSMHVLDKDQDGVISVDEVQKAVSCLRDQLSPEDLNALLCKLGAAAQGHDIKVSELLSLASKKEEEEEEARKKSERKNKVDKK